MTHGEECINEAWTVREEHIEKMQSAGENRVHGK